MKSTMLVADDVWPEIIRKNVQKATRRPHSVYFKKKIFVCVREMVRQVSRIGSPSGRRLRFQSRLEGRPSHSAGVCWVKLEMSWINGYHLFHTHEAGTNRVM